MARLLDKSWVDAYCDHLNNTEVPMNWAFWAAMSVIGSSVKRNVYLWYQNIQIFPNQYIILVGPPGIGKGQAIIPATLMAKEVNLVNYLSDKITPEKIVDKIAQGFNHVKTQVLAGIPVLQPQIEYSCTLLAKELPVLLSSAEWMHSLLCQLWDENTFDYQTKNKGSAIIKDLCVSLVGGCVPDYIRKMSKDSMSTITGGFTSRCMFVYSPKVSQYIKGGFGSPNGFVSKHKEVLIEDLRTISALEGEMHLTQDAKDLWEINYVDLVQATDFENEALANYKARTKSHIIKTAMVLSMADSDSLMIEEPHMKQAIKLVLSIQQDIGKIFRAVGESPLAVAQGRIMDYLEKKKEATRREIMYHNHKHVSDDQLKEILVILEMIRFVRIEYLNKDTVYIYEPKFAEFKGGF